MKMLLAATTLAIAFAAGVSAAHAQGPMPPPPGGPNAGPGFRQPPPPGFEFEGPGNPHFRRHPAPPPQPPPPPRPPRRHHPEFGPPPDARPMPPPQYFSPPPVRPGPQRTGILRFLFDF